MGETVLHQQEAVLLAHVLVARLAREAGARILFVKGPTAVAVGARVDRPSSDVDALVDPAAFGSLCGVLDAAGWVLRMQAGRLTHAAGLAFEHSAHFIHPQWPCDLDIHYLFPGFFAPADQVFEALWERRVTVEIAGQAVPSPDLLGQALVVALHALRDPGLPRSQADLDHLDTALGGLSPSRLASLSDLAARTGSAVSAAALLERVGAPHREPLPAEYAQLADWRLHQQGLGSSTALAAELRWAPVREKPAILWRALFPPREVLLGSHLATGASPVRLARLHVERWVRGARGLPRALRLLRGHHPAS